MNTLLEPPSSFFQPPVCIGSTCIEHALRLSKSPHFEIPTVGFSALAFPQGHGVTSKAPLSCVLSAKPFSPMLSVQNNDSALLSRDLLVRANHSATLTLREIE